MKYSLALIAATTALTFAPAAFAKDAAVKVEENIDYKDNGGYNAERHATQNLLDGTKKAVDKTADVTVNADGTVDKDIKIEATTDAKGMMNKKKEVSKTKVEHDEDGSYSSTSEHTKTDANGTNVKTKTKVDVDVDSDGNVTKKIEDTKVTDPKGLMNKTKVTTDTKIVNGVVTDKETSH